MTFSETWIRLLLSGILLSLTALLFSLLGSLALSRFWRRELPFLFRFSSGYFWGSCAFILLWKVSALLLGRAQWGLGLTYLVMTLFCIVYRKWIWGELKRFGSVLPVAALIFFSVSALSLLLWIRASDGQGQYVFDGLSLGSASTFTYSNITFSLFSQDRMPILAKHYDQSVLAAIPLFFGAPAVFVNFLFWGALTMTALIYQVFGLFRRWGWDLKNSTLGVLIVFLGNTALSFNHVLILDSQNPFLWMGYSDTLRAFGTALLFIVFLSELKLEPLKKHPGFFLFIPFFLTWAGFGAEDALLALGTLACLFAISVLKREGVRSFSGLALLLAIVLTGLGVRLGGMFTPTKYTNDSAVMNQLESPKPVVCPYFIHPMSVGHFAKEAGWVPPASHCGGGELKRFSSFPEAMAFLYQIEENLWSAMRALFWPLVSLAGLLLLVGQSEEPREWIQRFVLITAFFLVVGFLIAFTFGVQNGPTDFRKGELARFLIPGYGAGMVAVALFLYEWEKRMRGVTKGVFLLGACLFLGFPPLVSTAFRIEQNFVNPEIVGEKFKCFLSPGHPVTRPEPLTDCERLSQQYFQNLQR